MNIKPENIHQRQALGRRKHAATRRYFIVAFADEDGNTATSAVQDLKTSGWGKYSFDEWC
jgi:hypothetical protein